MTRNYPIFKEEEIVEIIEKSIDGITIIRITDNNGEQWINLDPIAEKEGYTKAALSYHINKSTNQKIFEHNIKYFKKSTDRNFLLFLNRQAFNQLRILVPRFRTSELIEQTAKLYTALETDEVRLVDTKKIEQLKQQLTTSDLAIMERITNILDNLEKRLGGQITIVTETVTIVENHEKRISTLEDETQIPSQWATIIYELKGPFVEKYFDGKYPTFEIYWRRHIGQSGYKQLPSRLMKKALMFFYNIDTELFKSMFKKLLSDKSARDFIGFDKLLEHFEDITKSRFQTRINPDYQFYA